MITTSRLITLCTVLCAILVAVSSAPVQIRDVYVPPVLYPHAGTVWKVGSYHNVTWDTSNPPANITNKKGIIVLAEAGRLDYENPLLSGFDILAGRAVVHVPRVKPSNRYSIVLFGDSGNYGQEFSIVD